MNPAENLNTIPWTISLEVGDQIRLKKDVHYPQRYTELTEEKWIARAGSVGKVVGLGIYKPGYMGSYIVRINGYDFSCPNDKEYVELLQREALVSTPFDE